VAVTRSAASRPPREVSLGRSRPSRPALATESIAPSRVADRGDSPSRSGVGRSAVNKTRHRANSGHAWAHEALDPEPSTGYLYISAAGCEPEFHHGAKPARISNLSGLMIYVVSSPMDQHIRRRVSGSCYRRDPSQRKRRTAGGIGHLPSGSWFLTSRRSDIGHESTRREISYITTAVWKTTLRASSHTSWLPSLWAPCS
jgi:hypothetical protein